MPLPLLLTRHAARVPRAPPVSSGDSPRPDGQAILWLVNDPHVEVLSYEFISLNKNHDFTAAKPWSGRLGNFECRLDAGRLQAVPTKHFASEAAARQELEPDLRAWEVRAELHDELRVYFRFSSARVVDRQPATGSVTVAVGAVEAAGVVETATVTALKFGMSVGLTGAVSGGMQEVCGMRKVAG